ncbi:PQQ-binding-like beta-propeller repeat protein [Fidelibacter multiformis]|uniref:outer membrane protein assembly factor BamB family protein n=1 Tax=Fidelibacter multiformis TaxID=3377529 RepID=UPI0037DDDF0B
MHAFLIKGAWLMTLGLLLASGCENREWTNLFDPDNSLDPNSWSPADLTIRQLSDNQLELVWENPDPRIERCVIHRQKNTGEWFIDYSFSASGENRWTDTVTLSNRYRYQVASQAGDSRSASVEREIIPIFPPPEGLAVESISETTVNLHWPAHPFQDFSGYRIDKAMNGGTFKTWASVSSETLGLLDNSLLEDSIYSYRLSAFTPRNDSPFGDTLSIRWEITRFETLWESFHSAVINRIAVSPDHRFVYEGDGDGILRKKEISDGSILWQVSHDKSISSLSVSPDGQLIAVGTDGWSSTSFEIWDPTGWQLSAMSHQGTVHQVAFSGDSQKAASCSEDKSIQIWDRSTQSLLRTLYSTDPVYDICFTPEGNHLLATGQNFSMALWDLNTGTSQHFTGHTGQVVAVASNREGTLYASGSMDWRIKGWNSRGTQLWSHDLSGSVTKLLFFPQGDTLLSAGEDKVLRCWDASSGEKIWEVSFGGMIKDITVDSSGERILLGTDDGHISFLDASSGQEIWQLETDPPLLAMGCTDQIDYMVCSFSDNTVQGFSGVFSWFSGLPTE